MKFQESEYFDYIGKSFKSNKNENLAPFKQKQLSVEEKLKLVLNEGATARNTWKNNTELLKDIGRQLGQDEASFMLETNQMSSRNDFWEFKDERPESVIWPERYNQIHNYFLLAKNKREREMLIKFEEVGQVTKATGKRGI